jgi:hypothetical protein
VNLEYVVETARKPKLLNNMDEKIKFGKYRVSVNIGFAGISRGGILDLADFYGETEWSDLTAQEQWEYFADARADVLADHIEYGMELINE